MASVFERVRKVVVDTLSVTEAEVVPSASFTDDLYAESLDYVELIMAIEEEFSTKNRQIEISGDDAEKLVTVQDIVDYLHDHGNEDTP